MRRLENSLAIEEAAERYRARFHRWPSNIQVLLRGWLDESAVQDPFQEGYRLDQQGRVEIVERY